MAKVSVQAKHLLIEFGPFEKIGSLSRGIKVPLKDIQSISTSANLDMGILGLRVGGTGVPRMIALGNFRKKGKWIFCSWRKGQQVVILDVAHQRFQKLVIGCDDAESLAKELNSGV